MAINMGRKEKITRGSIHEQENLSRGSTLSSNRGLKRKIKDGRKKGEHKASGDIAKKAGPYIKIMVR